MAKTTRLGLNLTEDESTSFEDWRKSIDGNNAEASKSNMQLIDDAYIDLFNRIGAVDEKASNLETECAKREDLMLEYKGVIDFGGATIQAGATKTIPFTQFNREPGLDEHFYALAKNNNGNVYYVNCTIDVVEYAASEAVCSVGSCEVLHDEERITTLESASGGGTKLYRHQIVSGYFTENGENRLYVVSTSDTPLTQPHEVWSLILGGGSAHVLADSGVNVCMVASITQPSTVYYFNNGAAVSKSMGYDAFTDIVTELEE